MDNTKPLCDALLDHAAVESRLGSAYPRPGMTKSAADTIARLAAELDDAMAMLERVLSVFPTTDQLRRAGLMYVRPAVIDNARTLLAERNRRRAERQKGGA